MPENTIRVYHGTIEPFSAAIEREGLWAGSWVVTDQDMARAYAILKAKETGYRQVVMTLELPEKELAPGGFPFEFLYKPDEYLARL